MEKELVRKFEAVSDSGDKHTVCEYQNIIVTTSVSSGSHRLKGTKEWRLANGAHVNQIDPETYEIVDTDEDHSEGLTENIS